MNLELNEVCYDATYVLDKVIWDKYDMMSTKTNVVKLIREYKELKSKLMYSVVLYESGMTSDMENIVSKTKRNTNGFADKVNAKIDAEKELNIKAGIFNKLEKSFTEKENLYYRHCLQNNNSEDNLRNLLNGLSKYGLLPIKNSCILKIALAFDIAVKNK